MQKEDVISVGKVAGAYGNKGACIIKLTEVFSDEIKKTDLAFFEIDKGLVPFFIESSESQGKSKIIVKFEDIDSEERVNRFIDTPILFRKKDVDAVNDDPIFDLIDFTIIDKNTKWEGTLVDIIDHPGNRLFCVSDGENEYLIPAHEDLIKKISERKRTITMNLPEGLLDLGSE